MCRQALCSVAGCCGVVIARGWCGKHYTRWRKNGHMRTLITEAGAVGDERVRRTRGGWSEVFVCKPDHPRATVSGGWVRKAILVYEAVNNTAVDVGDHVSFMNGNHFDLRPKNLILRNRRGRIIKCEVCGKMFGARLSATHTRCFCSNECRQNHRCKLTGKYQSVK